MRKDVPKGRLSGVNKPRAPAFAAFTAMVLMLLLSAPAGLSRASDIWGIDLPRGSEQVIKYRSVAIYKLRRSPRSAYESIARLLRTSSGIKIYRSEVGSTVVIFIEDTAGRRWSSIQISGISGKYPAFVTVTAKKSDSGWNWKRRGGDYVSE